MKPTIESNNEIPVLTIQKRSFPTVLLFVLATTFPSILIAENKFLDDLFLGVWSPFTSKWEASIPVCVWTESSDTLYKVTATGLLPGNRYYLTNDIGDQVSYSVFWHFGTNVNSKEKLRSGVLSRRNYVFSENKQCTDGPSAQISVKLNKNQINRAPPGIYDDTLLLMFSPI